MAPHNRSTAPRTAPPAQLGSQLKENEEDGSAQLSLAGEGVSAGDDLEDLPGDLGLALAIVGDGEVLAELDGVVGGAAHGAHPGGELAGERLLQGTEDLAVEVEREQRVEDLHGVLLELHHGGEGLRLDLNLLALHGELPLLGGEAEQLVLGGVHADAIDVADLALGGHGQQRLDDWVGAHQGHELGVEQLHLVHLLGDEERVDQVADGLRVLHGGHAVHLQLPLQRDVGAALEVGVALLAHADDGVLEAQLLELVDAGVRLLEHVVVEAAAEAALAGEDHERHLLDGAGAGEREVDVLRLDLLVHVVEHLDEGLREGAGGDDGLLRAPDLGGGHELHGLGDLLRVADGVDAAAELAEGAPHHQAAAAGARGGGAPPGGGGAAGQSRGGPGGGEVGARHGWLLVRGDWGSPAAAATAAGRKWTGRGDGMGGREMDLEGLGLGGD
nr:unnamed protein product [Digitaria exilis]